MVDLVDKVKGMEASSCLDKGLMICNYCLFSISRDASLEVNIIEKYHMRWKRITKSVYKSMKAND